MTANHPQLGSALSNIAELNRVYLEHQRETLRVAEAAETREGGSRNGNGAKKRKRDKKKAKRKDSKKAKKEGKGKKRKRDKSEKKHKSRKKSKKATKSKDRSSSSSDSSSSSGSGSGSSDAESDGESSGDAAQRPSVQNKRTPEEELTAGRSAMLLTKQILAKFPDVRADFRNILQSIDSGEAVSVAGVPDENLRNLLDGLFDALGLVKLPKSGARSLPRGGDKLLTKLSLVFDMTEEELAPFARPPAEIAKPEPLSKETDTRARDATRHERKTAKIGMTIEEAEAMLANGTVPMTSPTGTNQEPEATLAKEAVPATKPTDTNPPTVETQQIGPSGPPPKAPEKPPPRVLGPAMPPRAMLEAAAADLATDIASAVGPAPPDIVEEVELVGAEARVAAAKRVLQVVRANGDAYDVLGVTPNENSTAAVLKRAYWKLSLSVHPDKCDYARASDAFDAVKKAHELLLDPSEKERIDKQRDELTAREGFEEWLAHERSAAMFRLKRGEALPGDDALLRDPRDDAKKEKGRDEWMTTLPEQRRPVAGGEPAQNGKGNVKAFAMKNFVQRDARTIADWTAAPRDAEAVEAQLFLAAQEAKYSTPVGTGESLEDLQTKSLVEQYTLATRGKSLVTQHQEGEIKAAKAVRAEAKAKKAQAKENAKKKKGKGEEKKKDDDDDGTGWSYKPWNRETDLEAGRLGSHVLKPDEMLKKAGGDLSGRFDSGGTAER